MLRWLAVLFVLAVLAATSLFVGVVSLTPLDLIRGGLDDSALTILAVSRIPRTLALVLAGIGLAVAGTIMQMLTQNRFVEPATAGTMDAAGLGMLTALLLLPDLPVVGKMLVAGAFALAGTAIYLALLQRIPYRSPLLVPLVGILLGGVIGSITAFFAYRYDLMQSMAAWMSGDFSTVLAGRYEVLWLAFALAAGAYFAADRLTLAGMGRDVSTSLGLDHRRIVQAGLLVVALVTASVVVTAGMLPFVGLIVPNLVSLVMGDNLRRSLPVVAACGAILVLACDILGRTLNAPFEIPVGTLLGILGSLTFLFILLRRQRHA